jgi:hypothetical protein
LIQGNVTASKQVTDVIRDFGVALSTTLVGIVLRVFLNQLREDPSDIEEAIQNELFEQSQKLSGQIRAAIVAIDEVRAETADKLKNYVFAMRQVVDEHEGRVVELRDATSKLAKSVEKLATDLSAAEIPTGRLRDAAAETVAALEGARNAMAAVELGGRSLVTQFEMTGRSIQGISTQATALSTASDNAAASAEVARKAFGALGEASQAAAVRVLSSVESFEAAARSMTGTVEAAAAATDEHAAAMLRVAEATRISAAAVETAASIVKAHNEEGHMQAQNVDTSEPTRVA